MLNTVVVGVDGSDASKAALRWVGEYTLGDVHAVHAVSPALELLGAGFQIDTSAHVGQLREQLERDWIGDALPAERVQSRVFEDRVSRALIVTADEVGADAIVIGATGRERLGGLVGANAARLIHESDKPVVIVPTAAATRQSADGAIVVAMSGDSTRDRYLVDWARGFDDDNRGLTLVHSLGPARSSRRDNSDLEASVTSHLNQLTADSTSNDEIVVSLDDPLTAIIDNAATAPLIVMGSHHSSRIGGFLSGAIAQHLPTVSPCAVALVPLTVGD